MIAHPYTLPQPGAPERLRRLFFSPNARAVRFAVTGGLAGMAQLVLLTMLTAHGWHALVANTAAFLLAAQLNFALSSVFTWRDRRPVGTIGSRWLAFHGSIAGMAVVNMIVFALSRDVAPDLVASAAGICAAAVGNFLIGDRLVFRARHDNGSSECSPAARGLAALCAPSKHGVGTLDQ